MGPRRAAPARSWFDVPQRGREIDSIFLYVSNYIRLPKYHEYTPQFSGIPASACYPNVISKCTMTIF